MSGKVGVCSATSGLGTTNVTKVAETELMVFFPKFILTGQLPTQAIDIDTIGIILPINKHNYQPRSPKIIMEAIDKKFNIASTRQSWPVILDLPRNALEEDISIEKKK